MRFRFMGLPVKRLPYLFAQPYTGVAAPDPAHPITDAHQADAPCHNSESDASVRIAVEAERLRLM
jgi:hypothetical protein